MSIKKLLDNYKKELKKKLLITPGDQIRKDCSTYDCPMYLLMVTLNNNYVGVLEEPITCPKTLCKRIKEGMFKCSLSDNVTSVFSGFFVDDEFFSYESFLPKECLPRIMRTSQSNTKQLKEYEEVQEEEEEESLPVEKVKVVPKEKDKGTLKNIEEIKDHLIKDLDRYLGGEQTSSYTRIKSPTELVFTNPIESDLKRINKTIIIDKDFDYTKRLDELKNFFSGILKVKQQTSCDGCVELPNKNSGMSLSCSSCSRNEKIALLKDMVKVDNYKGA